MGKFIRRHPFSLLLAVFLIASICLWWRAGRYFDSVEFLTPALIVTVHSEVRMMMITAVVHDDSSWEIFRNSDVATVDAPWAIAAWPQLWGSPFDGEVGLIFVQAHLVGLLVLLVVFAFCLERRYLRRRSAIAAKSRKLPESGSRTDGEAQS